VPKTNAYDPSYVPKQNEILFEVPSLLGKSYSFFSDRVVISKGSKRLEMIPYAKLLDCDVQFFSQNESIGGAEGLGPGGPNYVMRITITLKEDPPREIYFTGNPTNGKLGSDLITWLNVKLAENESNQGRNGEKS
jgi:hypothetical protein